MAQEVQQSGKALPVLEQWVKVSQVWWLWSIVCYVVHEHGMGFALFR